MADSISASSGSIVSAPTTSAASATGVFGRGAVRAPLRGVVRALLRGAGRRWVAVGIVLFVAVGLRVIGLGSASLTHDEAWRANWSLDGTLDQLRRMPPLQSVMNRWVARVAGLDEAVLRLPYALAGIAAVVCLYLLTRWVFAESGVRVLDSVNQLSGAGTVGQQDGAVRAVRRRSADPYVWVLMLAAVHPVLVAYSRCLKVFSFEALASVLILWAGLACARCPDRRRFGRFLLAGVGGMALTFTASLQVAVWLPILLVCACRGSTDRHGVVRRLAVTYVILGAMGGICAVWFLGSSYRSDVTSYHGQMLHAWPAGMSAGALADWVLSAVYGAGRFVLGVHEIWPPLDAVIGGMLVLGWVTGVVVVWRRCRVLCVYGAGLCVAAIVAGALRLWPFGAFHTTMFLIPVMLVVVGSGLAACWGALAAARWSARAYLAGVCLVLPGLRTARHVLIDTPMQEDVRPALEYYAGHRGPGDALFVYYALDDPVRFYGRRFGGDWGPVLVEPRADRGRVGDFARRFDALARQTGRVWFLFGHPWADERRQFDAHLLARYRRVDSFETGGTSLRLFERIPGD